jgi:hypothetical protein
LPALFPAGVVHLRAVLPLLRGAAAVCGGGGCGGIVRALRYDETAQKLILPFKYADRTELARGLAKLMLRPGAAMLAAADALVPVPLHVSRLRQRRYNQAALLAGRLARLRACLACPMRWCGAGRQRRSRAWGWKQGRWNCAMRSRFAPVLMPPGGRWCWWMT